MKTVLFDLDGTLAIAPAKSRVIKANGKLDMKIFLGRDCLLDEPNENVVMLCQTMLVSKRWPAVVFVSARHERKREATEQWLIKYVMGIHRFHPTLYLRANDDYRSDEIVKKEILDKLRGLGYDPVLVIDDRDRVCKMWRENGVECWQIDNGDF